MEENIYRDPVLDPYTKETDSLPAIIKMLVIIAGIVSCLFFIQEIYYLLQPNRFSRIYGYRLFKEIVLIVLYTIPKLLMPIFSVTFLKRKKVALKLLSISLLLGIAHTVYYYSSSVDFRYYHEKLILVIHHIIPYAYYILMFLWLRKNKDYLAQ